MGAWSTDSKSHAHMEAEIFTVVNSQLLLTMKEWSQSNLSNLQVVKKYSRKTWSFWQGEVIDASVMSRTALRSFLDEQLNKAVDEVLFSLHMKATMMKVSDPYFRSLRGVYYKLFF